MDTVDIECGVNNHVTTPTNDPSDRRRQRRDGIYMKALAGITMLAVVVVVAVGASTTSPSPAARVLSPANAEEAADRRLMAEQFNITDALAVDEDYFAAITNNDDDDAASTAHGRALKDHSFTRRINPGKYAGGITLPDGSRMTARFGGAQRCCAADTYARPATTVRFSQWAEGQAALAAGAPVVVPCGTRVLLDASPAAPLAGGLRVEGTLEVLDEGADIALDTAYVYNCGVFKAHLASHGTKLKITLVGHETIPGKAGFSTKAFATQGGLLDLRGSLCNRTTWTTLAATARAGATALELAEAVPAPWAAGSEVMVAATGHLAAETEVVTIAAVSEDRRTLTLAAPGLAYAHAGVAPVTAEVALLTRNVQVTSEAACKAIPNAEADNKPMCGHMVIDHTPEGIVCGVELTNMGKHTTTGRYPLHTHMCGDAPEIQIRSNSVHRNHHRGLVIHGTSLATWQENVVYKTQGHLMLTEDGSEQGNRIVRNVLAMAEPPSPAWTCDAALANSGHRSVHGALGGCDHRCSHGTGIWEAVCGSRHDDDVNGLWITNPANFFVENHIVTDGDAAFRFETRGLTGRALLLSEEGQRKFMVGAFDKSQGRKEGLGEFRGNVAHSSSKGVKNYPTWNGRDGVRIEAFTAWKNGFGIFAKTKYPNQNPNLGDDDHKYLVTGGLFWANAVAVATIHDDSRVHLRDSDLAPWAPVGTPASRDPVAQFAFKDAKLAFEGKHYVTDKWCVSVGEPTLAKARANGFRRMEVAYGLEEATDEEAALTGAAPSKEDMEWGGGDKSLRRNWRGTADPSGAHFGSHNKGYIHYVARKRYRAPVVFPTAAEVAAKEDAARAAACGNGARWELVFKQQPDFFFSDKNNWAEAKAFNAGNPEADNFSILGELDGDGAHDSRFRSKEDGRFTFRLVHPDVDERFFACPADLHFGTFCPALEDGRARELVWKQRSNPAASDFSVVEDYESIYPSFGADGGRLRRGRWAGLLSASLRSETSRTQRSFLAGAYRGEAFKLAKGPPSTRLGAGLLDGADGEKAVELWACRAAAGPAPEAALGGGRFARLPRESCITDYARADGDLTLAGCAAACGDRCKLLARPARAGPADAAACWTTTTGATTGNPEQETPFADPDFGSCKNNVYANKDWTASTETAEAAETEEGEWKLLFRHTLEEVPFTFSADDDWAQAKRFNAGNPDAGTYSILGEWEDFRDADTGAFELKLSYADAPRPKCGVCPARCHACAAGDEADGFGQALRADGTCEHYCSRHGKCGSGGRYLSWFSVVDDCRGCAPEGSRPAELCGTANVWRQTWNPVDEVDADGATSFAKSSHDATVPGYEAIELAFPGSHWGGLERNNAKCFLDGAVTHGHHYEFAIGNGPNLRWGLEAAGFQTRTVELFARVPAGYAARAAARSRAAAEAAEAEAAALAAVEEAYERTDGVSCVEGGKVAELAAASAGYTLVECAAACDAAADCALFTRPFGVADADRGACALAGAGATRAWKIPNLSAFDTGCSSRVWARKAATPAPTPAPTAPALPEGTTATCRGVTRHPRSAEVGTCVFPFTSANGVVHTTCAEPERAFGHRGNGRGWCAFAGFARDRSRWGYCTKGCPAIVTPTPAPTSAPTPSPTPSPTTETTTETTTEQKKGWQLVYRQTGLLKGKDWKAQALSMNEDDETADNFSLLGNLEAFRSASDSTFKFKLTYPGIAAAEGKANVWKQASNPAVEATCVRRGRAQTGNCGVEGYEPLDVAWTWARFGGLEYSNGRFALMDGSAGHGWWFYSIGATRKYGGANSFPATRIRGGPRTPAASVVELYAWVE